MGEAARVSSSNKRILVAVDESEESMYALSWCLANLLPEDDDNASSSSSSSSSTLLLLYVKPPPPAYSSLDTTGYLFGGDFITATESYSKGLADAVMSRAQAIYQNFNTNVRIEKKVGVGDAKDVICMAVEKLRADILVMGSHDYGFLKRAFLGSVSDHCAKHVKCALVIVKRPVHP